MRAGEDSAARRLFAGLVLVPIEEADGWQAGQWRRDSAARGVTLWQADCLIAAAAARLQAVLATGNPKDFPMAGLRIEHWPVGG